MKKLVSLVIVMALVLSLAVGAAAQTVAPTPAQGAGSITVSNAYKGVTYSIYKLFDATVNADGSSIAYTGDIPTSLSAYFIKDAQGNITATAAGEAMSDEAKAALKAWTETVTAIATQVSDGTALTFDNLAYGYYVMTSSQGEQYITVDSTKPNVTVVDKNITTPGQGLTKGVDKDNISIGDTVTYTVSFKTANYDGKGESAKQVTSYTIKDTLPDFLTDVTVTSITINGAAYTVDGAVPQFENKEITIPWATSTTVDGKTVWTNLYANGAEVVITYTAVVTDAIATTGEGVNRVSLEWKTTDGEGEVPDGDEPQVSVKSYAIAIKKVDQSGNALEGATFQLPFYVKAANDGSYIYAGANPGAGLVNTLTTPASGEIVIKGLKAEQGYSVTETEAPAGYNKLTTPITITATKSTATTTNVTKYLNADGNVVDEKTDISVNYTNDNLYADVFFVVNKTGTELPSTGGMGTTIFYALGSLMFVGALVLLVTNKRMKAE